MREFWFQLQTVVPRVDDEDYAAAILERPVATYCGESLREVVAGRRVLVTGAGGFIGGALVRLIASLGPKRLVLIENGEHALYSIDAQLAQRHPALPRRALYCDVRDAVSVNRGFAEERPQIVFHAAALKQLPLMEAHPREAVLTNTIGALNVARAAEAAGARAAILISTDKAVRASSVLGASKRLAEAWFQAMDLAGGATRFGSVRFGNVFGSTGSVVPLFHRQIEAGGPVTLTDERMTRYFMTRAEAAGLVLSAAGLVLKEEARGHLYLLETGPAVPIAELARRMILRSGGRVDEIGIAVIGARPGERLSERLIHDQEEATPTDVDGVRRLSPRSWSLAIMRQQMIELERACGEENDERLWRLLSRFVPGFAQPLDSERQLACGEA